MVAIWIDRAIPGRSRSQAVDRAIREMAERQHGVVSRAGLLAGGVTRDQVEWRVRHGRLHVIHHGVYAVGHSILIQHGRWMAAVLAGGPSAALSHLAGGALRGLHPITQVIDVTAPGARARPGLRLHRVLLPDDEIEIVDGIPVTTVPRTLLDMAAMLSRHRAEKAINEAVVRRLWDRLSLPDMVDRHPRAPGTATIRAILAAGRIGQSESRSELEVRFFEFLDRHGLPRPTGNASIFLGERHVDGDMVWPAARLVVELDSRRVHDTPAAFEADRERDRRLAVIGWRVIRVTWRQLHDQPAQLAADLRVLLGLR